MSKRHILAGNAAFIVIHHHLEEQKMDKPRKRRHWVTPVLKNREYSGGSSLLLELRIGNVGQFENFVRMSPEDFAHLLALIEPMIRKKDTNYRSAIPPNERLAITLRFLATGDSFTSLMYLFKVSKQTISTVVMEVCSALINVLRQHVKVS